MNAKAWISALLLLVAIAASIEAQQTIYWKKDYISDGAGTVAVATPAHATDSTAPTSPTSLTIDEVKVYDATFSWTASTDGGTGIAGYRVYRGASLVGVKAVGTTTFTDPTLRPATAYIYKVAAFDGAGNQSALSSPLTVITGPLIAAAATSTSQVNIAWDAIGAADHYVLSRRTTGGYSVVGSPSSPSFSDTGLSASTTYIYQVVAVDAMDDPISGSSYPDLATTVSFTDDPLVVGVTAMKAAHISELQQTIDLVRTAAGSGGASWTSVSGGGTINAAHINELRTNLNAALTALSIPLPVLTDPGTIPSGTKIKKAHIAELRQTVK